MGFAIDPTTASGKALRGTASEQVDKAIAEIDDRNLERDEAVHQVRKRCKKLRGLFRLYRAPLEDAGAYKPLNLHFRDVARGLSELRDADVLLETYDALMQRFEGDLERRDFANVRRQLTLRRRELTEAAAPVEERLGEARAGLLKGRKLLDEIDVVADGYDAVAGGFAKTYGRTSTSMRAALDGGGPADFHEWRKRAKYHRYHCRLLRRLWPAEMMARRNCAKDVADLLGDGHDLTVLREVLQVEADRFAAGDPLDRLDALALKRRAELHAAATPLGEQLCVEKPKRLARRVGRYWDVAVAAKRADDLPAVHKVA